MNLHFVFGGTFDPFHFGHKACLETLLKHIHESSINKEIRLTILIHDHHLKSERMFTPEYRVKLVQDIIENLDTKNVKLEVVYSNQPSLYEALTKDVGISGKVILVFGHDVIQNIEKFKYLDKLFEITHEIVVFRRSHDDLPFNESLNELETLTSKYKIVIWPLKLDLQFYPSSTLIRSRIHERLVRYPETVSLEITEIPAVLGVILSSDLKHFLLMKHKASNMLAIPGGFLTADQSPVECLFKEFEEELGVPQERILSFTRKIDLIDVMKAYDETTKPVTVILYGVLVDPVFFNYLKNGFISDVQVMDKNESDGFVICSTSKSLSDLPLRFDVHKEYIKKAFKHFQKEVV